MPTNDAYVTRLQYGAYLDKGAQKAVFSIYSANAQRIELYLYSRPMHCDETGRLEMIMVGNCRWEVSVPVSRLTNHLNVIYYGYRAWGPNWVFNPQWKPGTTLGFIEDCDDKGNRFNPNKLLLDPWATEISHDPQPRLSDIDPNEYDDAYYSGEGFRDIDTGKIAPKGMLIMQDIPVSFGKKPQRAFKEEIIYEVHLRGFTRQDKSLPEEVRGTYYGAGLKASYLKDLGITAIELLPVHQFASEQNDDGDRRGDNYLGYMTLGFFAPNRRYSSDKSPGGPTREFQDMVRTFHNAGIKVYLDVVYNHTCEGLLKRTTDLSDSREDDCKQYPDRASLLSLRGLDNATYYTLRTSKSDRGMLNRRYQDNSACGGNLNVTFPAVRSLILGSLKYWTTVMGVDGFRFDLAPILGSTIPSNGYNFDIVNQDNFLHQISTELPVRSQKCPSGADLIAEPWALGPGDTYQLGHFPDCWAEWNDVYRTILRQFENKLHVVDLHPDRLANVISGSEKEFRCNSSRKEPVPWNSVNYLASHDGFTLRDVFSYSAGDDSWDHEANPGRQRKAVRNAIALLMTSAGVPMITGGDELFRTQSGLTNVVALDTSSIHLDWKIYNSYSDIKKNSDLESIELICREDGILIYQFVRAMIAFHKHYTSLRPENYFSGVDTCNKEIKDITWYRSDGGEMSGSDWNHFCFLAWRIKNKEYRRPSDAGSFYIAYNWNDHPTECVLPPAIPEMHWYRYADTAQWFEYAANCDTTPVMLSQHYMMEERSVLVLFEK